MLAIKMGTPSYLGLLMTREEEKEGKDRAEQMKEDKTIIYIYSLKTKTNF